MRKYVVKQLSWQILNTIQQNFKKVIYESIYANQRKHNY